MTRTLALLAATALVSTTGAAFALDATLPPTYGQAKLNSGFTPDPREIVVDAGGPSSADGAGGACVGYTREAPDYRLFYTAGVYPLYFVVRSGADTVLVISGPDGAITCDDESGPGSDAEITYDSPLSGQYNIWVGTYGTDPIAGATLQITEDLSVVAGGILDWTQDPLYGTHDLPLGFTPDPFTVDVAAGGPVDASLAATDECRGYMSGPPTIRLNYQVSGFPLYIYAQSETDTTMAVNTPDGAWVCDDDSGVFPNPMVSWDSPASGQYDIWLGTYSASEAGASATIYVSEVGGPEEEPEEPGVPLDPTLDPVAGSVQLTSGFTPDPFSVDVTAGGTVEAGPATDYYCYGYTTQAPTYRLTYEAGVFPLYLYVVADEDTTLTVNTPAGDWVCDDDSGESTNPVVAFDAPTTGVYDIWVGTYSSDPVSTAATLYISETSAPEDEMYEDGDMEPTVLDWTLPPVYGEVTLTSGFNPDPQSFDVMAGGDGDAYYSSADPDGVLACDGAVTSAPTYRLNYTAGAWPLILSVDTGEEGIDSTLVVRGPDGTWSCNDDGENGVNPSLTFQPAASGTYDIWVGDLWFSETPQPATLYISEIESR